MSSPARPAEITDVGEQAGKRGGEQSRARYPDLESFVERDGQQLFYEVYGEGEQTVFLIPTCCATTLSRTSTCATGSSGIAQG